MEIGQSQEDYLEAIYLLHQSGVAVKNCSLAKKMVKSKPSVTVAVQTLEQKGYLEKLDHGILRLTEKGERLAIRINERHNFFHAYFTSIGLSEEEAQKNACAIEHVLSETCYQKMKAARTQS